jgi:hypothetical protein
MTSIGNITGSASISLTTLYQQICRNQRESTGQSTGSVEKNEQGIESLKGKMDTAISEALKKLDKSSSADEIMATIKTAIDSTMEANGLDPEAMKGKMPPPPDAAGGAMGGPNRPAGEKDGFMAKIEELLSQNGFDVDKFRSEMESKMSAHSKAGLDVLSALDASQGVNTQA